MMTRWRAEHGGGSATPFYSFASSGFRLSWWPLRPASLRPGDVEDGANGRDQAWGGIGDLSRVRLGGSSPKRFGGKPTSRMMVAGSGPSPKQLG